VKFIAKVYFITATEVFHPHTTTPITTNCPVPFPEKFAIFLVGFLCFCFTAFFLSGGKPEVVSMKSDLERQRRGISGFLDFVHCVGLELVAKLRART